MLKTPGGMSLYSRKSSVWFLRQGISVEKKKKRNKNFFVSAINPTGVSPRRGESILGSAHLPETPF